MPVVVGGRPRWRGLVAFIAFIVAFALPAAAAQADQIIATPRVQGFGKVTGFPPDCVNNSQNPATSVTCPTRATAATTGFPPAPVSREFVATPSGHWSFARWENCTGSLFNEVMADGNRCRMGTVTFLVPTIVISPRAVFVDNVGPTVTSAVPVYSTSLDRGVSFNLGANEPLSLGTCSVDGQPGQPCHVPRQFSEGSHTVRVQGRDLSGNVGGLSGTLATFRVVDTKLLTKPPAFHSSKRPRFTFSTPLGAFQCALDAAGFTPCTSPYTPPADLAEGTHTFRVRAIDGPEYDRVPATHTWVVDTVRPDTALDPLKGPGQDSIVTALTAEFGFTASEPGTIQCRLDAAPFARCTSPKSFTNLPFGDRKFEIRTVDRAGNVDPTPAVRRWTIQARDNDGDGFNQRSDCNDANPLIHPGANEVANNGIDEDCDGADLVVPPTVLDPTLSHSFKAFKRFTKLTAFRLRKVPAGSTVRATCKIKTKTKKKKCRGKARKPFVKRNASGTVQLKKYTRIKLRPGTKITVRTTKPGTIGAVDIYTIRKGKAPKRVERCLPIGEKKPVAC